MIILRNTTTETFNFNLLQDYEGIGRTLFVVGKSRTGPLPDKIKDEKEIQKALAKGIVKLDNIQVSGDSRSKKSFKERIAKESHSEKDTKPEE